MTSFERVIQILDDAIGGPDVQIGVHRAFWRVTRDQFVAKKVQGLDLVVVGRGSESNLVKALKGEAPFGVDVPGAAGAVFGRMPIGRPAVAAEDIAFIERWIDDGCVEDPIATPFSWRPTTAPPVAARYDDVFFVTPEHGWAVNSAGQILGTSDGGVTWQEQLNVAQQFGKGKVYLRCIGFASASRGWVGTTTSGFQLFQSADGGATWSLVTNLPAEAPAAVCGLSVVNESVVYAAGTNFPFPTFDKRPAMMKTLDGGTTWTAWDMTGSAALLVDTYFVDPLRGWVVGGKVDPAIPPGDPSGYQRENVKPVVLYTDDGGQTWDNRVTDLEQEFPLGEWGWKIHFVDDQVGYVSLENFTEGAILKTVDGGQTWKRFVINDPQDNANLEGIGFLRDDVGWVGGWGLGFKDGPTSASRDGGRNWIDANEVGNFINRFRFLGDPLQVGYAAGTTVYKYSTEPAPATALLEALPGPRLLDSTEPLDMPRPLRLEITVPSGASHIDVDVWGHFGEHVRQLLDEPQPAAGSRTVEWDVTDDAGQPLGGESFILRVTVDDQSESRILRIR